MSEAGDVQPEDFSRALQDVCAEDAENVAENTAKIMEREDRQAGR